MYRITSIVLLLSLSLTTINLLAQPNIEWEKTLGGSSTDIAYDVEQTTDGGYIIAGESRSEDGDVAGGLGWKDYWVVKLAHDGTLEWERSYGGTNHDIAEDILQTTDGGYIVAGRSDSSNGDVSDHRNLSDYWIVKLSNDGSIEWERSLGGNNNEFAYAIEQTADGGYLVGGYSNSSSGDVTGNHGDYDYWVVKLSGEGTLEWEKSLGGSRDDFLYSLATTNEGGCILAGRTMSNDGDVTGQHGGGNFVYDYWVVKLSPTGELEWQKALGGTDQDIAYSVRQTADGSYIVAGFSGSSDGDVTGNHGDWDYWIVKLTSTGDISWQKSLGGFADEIAHSIRQTTDGGYITLGYSKSNFGQVSGNHGNMDFWAVKITSTGDIDWQKSLGGTDEDRGFSIKQTDDETGFILAGRSKSNNGEVSGHQGEDDFWVVKLGPCGVNTNLEVEEHTIISSEVALSSTYQWINCSDSSPIAGAESSSFTPDTGGDYALIVTNGSCVDTSACISICPLNADLMVVDNTIESAGNSPNATFQWIDCNNGAALEGEVGPIFEATLNGEYAVIITEENCSVMSECTTVCPETINGEIVDVGGALQASADSLSFNFQWIDCSNTTPISGQNDHLFTPDVSGDYAVVVSQGNCSTTSDCFTVCLIDTHISSTENTLQSSADTPSSTYQWINCSNEMPIDGETGQTYTPTISGDYAVIVNEGSCVDTSDCITVCLIDPGVTVVDNTLYSLADTLNSTFQWIDCNLEAPIMGEVASSFTPAMSGLYAVAISQGSCVDTSGCVNLVIVGLEEPIHASVKVFPNPVQDVLFVEVEAKLLGATYRIYDISGKQVAVGRIITKETSLHLSGLSNGVYMLKMESLDEVVSIRFIKG